MKDMYNMNETRFSIGVISRSYMIVHKKSKKRYQAQSDRQKWISVMKYIYMNEESIIFIILKEKKILSS